MKRNISENEASALLDAERKKLASNLLLYCKLAKAYWTSMPVKLASNQQNFCNSSNNIF